MAIRKEILGDAALISFGIVFLAYNRQYSMDTMANPGPGIFPLIIGVVLVGLGVWQLVLDWVRPAQSDCEEKGRGSISIRSLRGCLRKDNAERGVLLMIGSFIIYLLAVQWIGFFVSNIIFVVIASRIMGARNWGGPVALSAGIAVFCYFLFEVWLKLSFPRGILF
jgi:hypothetical protein